MVAIAVSLAAASGCGGESGGSVDDTDRRFHRLEESFSTLEECEEATSGTFFNCLQELALCENRGFWIILTDIVTEGDCEPVGTGLRCTVRGSGDLPEGTTLAVDHRADPIEIDELPGANPWAEAELTAAARERLADDCDALTGRFWWRP